MQLHALTQVAHSYVLLSYVKGEIMFWWVNNTGGDFFHDYMDGLLIHTHFVHNYESCPNLPCTKSPKFWVTVGRTSLMLEASQAYVPVLLAVVVKVSVRFTW